MVTPFQIAAGFNTQRAFTSLIRAFVACLVSLLAAQTASPPVDVRGEITGGNGVQARNLTVELLDLRNQTIDRAPVFVNGSFEFQRVPTGEYTVLVTFNGKVLLRTLISVRDLTAFISLHLPDQTAAIPASGSISIRRLEHKIPRKAVKEFNRAKKAERDGDASKAVNHLATAVSIDPDFFEAHTALGANYLTARRYDLAVAAFRRARELEPESAHAHSNLAMALVSLGRHDEAISTARAAVRIDSLAPKPRYVLGLVLMTANTRSYEALEHLRAAAHLFPRARLAIAKVLVSIGQTEQARQELGRYLDSGPTEGRAQVEAWIASLRSIE